MYTSRGCFHNKKNLFIFHKNRTVDIFFISSEYISRKKGIGRLTLSNQDIEDLDNLFKFYEAHEEFYGCTTIDTIEINVMMKGFTLRKYVYHDGSCTVENNSKYLSLNSLLSRLDNNS